MATCNAARILRWDGVLGSIEAGKRADLIVVDGALLDPYDTLIHAKETDLKLVMINGIARYGVSPLMQQLAPSDQTVRVGGETRQLFLKQQSADPDVAQVALSKASSMLADAFQRIAQLAKELEKPKPARAQRLLDAQAGPVWSLALDEISSCGVELSPRLPFDGPGDFTGPERAPRVIATSAPPLSTILKAIDLDALTVADDGNFLQRIHDQPNLPVGLKANLHTLF
jgi:5-methylthioadenosine/S-adenosylhomocysteine deaminase